MILVETAPLGFLVLAGLGLVSFLVYSYDFDWTEVTGASAESVSRSLLVVQFLNTLYTGVFTFNFRYIRRYGNICLFSETGAKTTRHCFWPL